MAAIFSYRLSYMLLLYGEQTDTDVPIIRRNKRWYNKEFADLLANLSILSSWLVCMRSDIPFSISTTSKNENHSNR